MNGRAPLSPTGRASAEASLSVDGFSGPRDPKGSGHRRAAHPSGARPRRDPAFQRALLPRPGRTEGLSEPFSTSCFPVTDPLAADGPVRGGGRDPRGWAPSRAGRRARPAGGARGGAGPYAPRPARVCVAPRAPASRRPLSACLATCVSGRRRGPPRRLKVLRDSVLLNNDKNQTGAGRVMRTVAALPTPHSCLTLPVHGRSAGREGDAPATGGLRWVLGVFLRPPLYHGANKDLGLRPGKKKWTHHNYRELVSLSRPTRPVKRFELHAR